MSLACQGIASAALSLAVLFAPLALDADTELASPITLSDGTVATPFDRCGAADECASVKYTSGDELVIYSEGAAKNRPYVLRFALLKNGVNPVVEYDAEAETVKSIVGGREKDIVATYTLYRGKLRLDFYTNKDGTLKPRFTNGAAGPI